MTLYILRRAWKSFLEGFSGHLLKHFVEGLTMINIFNASLSAQDSILSNSNDPMCRKGAPYEYCNVLKIMMMKNYNHPLVKLYSSAYNDNLVVQLVKN